TPPEREYEHCQPTLAGVATSPGSAELEVDEAELQPDPATQLMPIGEQGVAASDRDPGQPSALRADPHAGGGLLADHLASPVPDLTYDGECGERTEGRAEGQVRVVAE